MARFHMAALSFRSRFPPTGSRARCATCWTRIRERGRLSTMTDAIAAFSGPGGLDPAQLGRLVDQLPVLLWSSDLDLRVTSRRGGGIALLDPPPAADEGLRIGDAIEDPGEVARVIEAHEAALRGTPTTYEVRVRGRTFSALVEPLRDAAGAAFDITDSRRAENALQASENRLRAIIESEPECVKLVDHQGRLLDMNPAGLEMIQAANIEQVRGMLIAEVVAPEHREAFNHLHQRVFAGESGTLEFEIVGLHGKRRWLTTHAVPLRDASGRIQAALGITRDITEARRAEEQLRASRGALRSLATRQQDVREDERTRIAREIHDSLGQALTALKLQLVAAEEI